jgi:exopolysaccharide biosynthesis polyprenyl glycosylphosphotransferase
MTDPRPRLPLAGAVPFGRRPKLRLVDTATPELPALAVDTPSSGHAWARAYRTRLRLTDSGVIVGAVAAALLVRFGAEQAHATVGATRADYWTISLLIVVTWLATLSAFHTRDSRVVGVGATEYKQVVNASALAFGLLAIGFLIFQVDIARGYFILALPLGIVGLTLERWLWRKWLLHQRLFGHYLARVIVVGKRDDVEYVVNQIHEKSGAAYWVVGAALESGEDSINAGNHSVPVVSDLAHVADAVAALGADTVIVAGQPSGGSQYIRNLGWELEATTAELVLSSRLTDVAGPRIHFRPVEGLPLIHVEIPHFEGAKHVLKRSFDLIVSALALLVLMPALAVIALCVKLDSAGPVLFRQERCGRNGLSFHMVKFRSMVQTAEDDLAGLLDKNEGAGVLFKIRNDPRITRVGRFLRKYSLDELPQLWNILVGDMSLVGPRPPLPREVECYETPVHRRLYIKPGLTGMWQVNGRSNLSWEDSVRLDLYYVENWSLTGDLMIMWRTVKAMAQPEGAY